MYAAAKQAADGGLTLTEILVGIPHDFAAVVVYLMLALFLFFIWHGSRSGTARSGAGQARASGAPADAAERDR